MNIRSSSLNSRRNIRGIAWFLVILTAFAAGFFLHPLFAHIPPPRTDRLSDTAAATDAILCAQGPWGRLDRVPITLTAPDELLGIRVTESSPILWVFNNFSRDQFVQLLDSLELPLQDR